MKFTPVLAATILAGVAAAAPGRGLEARVKARASNTNNGKGSRPLQAVDKPSTVKNQTNVEYSSNWSGAVLVNPPSAAATYTAVTGTFTVPEPTGSGSGSQAASAWVGIDGDTYSNAILQTGVDFTVTDGQASFDAWYEWYPDYAYDFSDLEISAGDVIVTVVESYSSTSGIATIENQSTGKKVSQELSSSYALGGINAEWIVEDFEEGDSLVNLVDFGTVTFTGAVAEAAGGESVGVDGATIIEIVNDDDQVVTDVTIDSDSSVTIQYV
ncbi:aspergillopepsin-2 precursor [Aspergillus heteromorphus CBS 117.55]|uniref:Aspergillopepsin-2 n=1 Tax=Aspergillus heteromorphus CBS 117.55 TaxID=1448321 RepID=A0A317UWY0_9EURO|nr:aspergillopepsin-2 precursor [Aspergillus heteromorphus CBS 117.55]PWY66026.1 aspergillopepsin-2 precursor [Aspergillus heteromorphus CBS 117.55]